MENKSLAMFLSRGFHFKFEKADLCENKAKREAWFELAKNGGWLPAMIEHRDQTYPIFKWENFDAWMKTQPQKNVSKHLPYPPVVEKGKYAECCETCEEEEEVTKRYVKENPTSFDGFEEFVKNYKLGQNEIVDVFKARCDLRVLCYDWFNQLLEVVEDKEKTKAIAVEIHKDFEGEHFGLLQLTHYILSWYFKAYPYCIPAGYPRLVEYYWDGVGDWVA